MVANKLSCEPEERLLKVVVGLCGDIVVLQVLLAVEGDGLGLDLALLDIHFVAAENDGNVFADTDQIAYSLSALSVECQLILTYGASLERSCT